MATPVAPLPEPPCPVVAASTAALLEAVANASVRCVGLRPSVDYQLTNTLVLGAHNVTLEGTWATLTMVNETHVVRVEGPGVVTLREVRLRGGHVNGGGDVNGGAGLLVDRDGTAVLQDVTVSHNVGGGILNQGRLTLRRTSVTGNPASAYFSGSGVVNEANATLWMEGTLVEANAAAPYGKYFGGGLTNRGELSGRDCTIRGNHAKLGGGVYVESGRVELRGTVVEANAADENGGGIVVNGGLLLLEECDVLGNNATKLGGGLATTHAGAFANVSASRLRLNMAGHAGGGASNMAALWLQQTDVSNNSASLGGGLYNYNPDGGAVPRLTAVDSNLTANVAHGKTSPNIAGAALYNDHPGAVGGAPCSVVLAGALLRDNVARGDTVRSAGASAGATIFSPTPSVVYELPAPKGHSVGFAYVCQEVDCPGGSNGACLQICDFRNESACLARHECFFNRTLVNVSVVDGDFPAPCLARFYGNSTAPASQTSPSCDGLCPAGHVCPTAGTVTPRECEAGHFCPPGADQSFPCSNNTWSNRSRLETQADCESCPRNSHAPAGSTSAAHCACDAGHYRNNTPVGTGCECVPGRAELCCCDCPIGVSCGEGAVTATLRLRPGFWRQSNATAVARPCLVNATCAGDLYGPLGDYCNSSLSGIDNASPYCTKCLGFPQLYLDEARARCRPCRDARALALGICAGAVGLLLLLLVLRLQLLRHNRRHRSRPQPLEPGASGDTRGDAGSDAGADAGGDACADTSGDADGGTRRARRAVRRVATLVRTVGGRLRRAGLVQQTKVALGFYQIVTHLRDTYGVVMPPSFIGFSQSVGVLNLDPFALPGLHIQCFGLTTFFSQLLARALAPLVLIGASLVYYGARRRLADALPFVLWVTFLVFSLVSAPAFQAFSCEQFDDGRAYLRADWAVQCWDEHGRKTADYSALQTLAIVVIAIYPLGVPASYALLLFATRSKRLGGGGGGGGGDSCGGVGDGSGGGGGGGGLGDAIAFLTAQYSPHAFWWELVAVSQRLLLASFYVLVWQGRMLQLLLALATQLAFVIAQVHVAPHALPNVRHFATGADIGLLFALLCCLVIKQQTLVFELRDAMPPQLMDVYGISSADVAPVLLMSTACVLAALFAALLLAALPGDGSLSAVWRRLVRCAGEAWLCRRGKPATRAVSRDDEAPLPAARLGEPLLQG